MDTTKNEKNNNQLIPLAIIVAGLLIAGAVYFGGGKPSDRSLTGAGNQNAGVVVDPISNSDHFIGNRNAEVVVVVYSDFECPFCKVFHNTMNQIMNTYNGKVAWVYRQFPIVQLHSRAIKEAEASECVAELGGNDMFWKFANKIFETTTSNNTLDPLELPKIAGDLGLDVTAFNNCLSSGKYTNQIQADVVAAGKAGAQGTPYSIILVKGKNVGSINGAQPFEQVKAQLDTLVK